MQASNTPRKSAVPFADSGTKNAIPVASQIGVTPGVASFTDGFPPLTMTPLAAGGVPPHGADFNGIFNFLSAAVRWAQSGGGYAYDSAFSTAIGGYPKGAWLRQASGNGYWLSLLDNNISNPDTGGAGWVATGAGIATTGQAQAMIDDSVLLTPKKLVDAFTPGQVLSFMGLNQQLPGGLILKSGAFNGVSGTINFPTPFPNLAFAVFGAESAVLGAESLDFVMFQYRGLDRFKFNPELRNKSGTYPNAASVRYLAIGY